MNAVIYARFSSDRQSETSIDAQVRACTEYADSHHINILRIYKDEAVSGTTANRLGYQEMLADAFDSHFSMILIHKYDRIARNLEEQVSLQKRLKQLNIRLVAVAQDYGEGKDANLSKGIQWVLGEYYSANLSEETKKGHKEIALKGLHNGGYPPFGYDIVDQKYLINEPEAYWVRRMFETCLGGGQYKYLVEEMAAYGIVGKRGKPIKYTQIYEILQNEKYTGTYVYSLNEEEDRNLRRSKPHAIRVEDAIPAIVTKKQFIEAQNILASRKHAGRQKHKCSGLVYCSCGAKMHISHTERKGHKYTRFICSEKCGVKGIDASLIDEAVDAYISELLSEKNMSDVEAAIRSYRSDSLERAHRFDKERKEQISLKESELENLMQGLMSGAFKDNYEFVNDRITNIRKEIEVLKDAKAPDVDDKRIREWLENIRNAKDTPKTFIDRIEILGDEISIYSVFGNLGCGGTIEIFPSVLWAKKYRSCKTPIF